MCERVSERPAELLNNSSSAEVSLRRRVSFVLYRCVWVCASQQRFRFRIHVRNAQIRHVVRPGVFGACDALHSILKRKIVKVPKWLHCDFKLVPLYEPFLRVTRSFFAWFLNLANAVAAAQPLEARKISKYTFGVFINLIYDSLKMTSLAPTNQPNDWMPSAATELKCFQWGAQHVIQVICAYFH